MRRLDLTFSALLLPLDFAVLLAAAMTGYALRFSRAFVEIRPILTAIPFSEYFATVIAFIIVWMLIFALAGLYSTHPRKAWNELGRIIISSTAGIMVVIASIFFGREFTASRFLVLAMWGFAILYVSVARLSLRTIRHALLKHGYGHQRIAMVGQGKTAQDIQSLYKTRPILGYTLVKHYKQWSDATARDIEKLAVNQQIDGILLADSSIPKEQAVDAIAFADEHHLTIRYLADVFAARVQRIEIATDGGIPILEVKRTRLDGWGRIAKRAFDVTFSLIILILVSPILLIIGLAQVIEDGWPIIFRNTRIGERGRPFDLFKLRSMWRKYSIGPQFKQNLKENLALEQKLIKEKSIKEGPVYKIMDDPRVTPVGRFIRRWSIDELPQFINVLRGEMSIIGPRPHQPREVELYASHHRRVLAIKPGITGLAQISGRSDLEFEDEVRLDAWYIDNWSPALDFYILLKTPFAVLQKKGAY